MKQSVTIKNLDDLDRAAAEFVEKTRGKNLLAFYGQMGAGKTTFTVALCRALGVRDNVCSPTFTIISEYRDGKGRPVYHFDFYRIKNLSEAMDIGVEDYFYSGDLCIMEWPENIEELLPDETLKVYITVNPDQSRSIVWED
ncbi:MAG: tRNA (adenosine(37)-N6)-threonylcarbamoyltransferase complex ATPase subunit type 1 TsaE [Bacteroidales bacterium]|nr:tRNA (adenosine(37)-N6)-threonylcarbamoyltransferase complex ATPase subunit type 1 TsaE [Bacteroidales bacterium]